MTAIVFILWDEHFTRAGHWGFNTEYMTGVFVGSLPIEEVLFFLCIPYACCFTFFAIAQFYQKRLPYVETIITITIILTSLIIGIISLDEAYTATTFISLAITLAVKKYILKSNHLTQFYLTYLILMAPFFLVNGILTGSFIDAPVVWYNDDENLGIRLGTIPVEDVFYGMLMLLLPMAIAERLESIQIKKALAKGSLNATNDIARET